MKPNRTLALLLLGVLSACHQASKTTDQRTASGQVLQGSISDAMIPYESLKSRPPLAPRIATKGAAAAAQDDGADSEDAAGADAPAEPAPAAAPSPAIHF